jgi:hypothetical protein|nr:hypothetical protein [Kofleriaceae bacterium]
MYRYGDGTPFPLDENFIDTLTSAVEACTSAFEPLVDMDDRRLRAKEARRDGDRELAKLGELEKTMATALGPYLTPADKKGAATAQAVAQKLAATVKQSAVAAKQHVDGKVAQLEAQAAPAAVAGQIIQALGAFFAGHQLPNAKWIMSWDVRGVEPTANAVATAGKLSAQFTLGVDNWRVPIRVDQLADGVVVHMMKKGVFGKAKPAPIELAKYVVVAFERTESEQVITLKESGTKASPGLRFAVGGDGATWVSITPAGDTDGEPNPLDAEDIDGVRRLSDAANKALAPLLERRALVELMLSGKGVAELAEPKQVPLELLAQLTPLSRIIRERSRMSGELVLKRDIGDNRREELFVPRATLAQQFLALPEEYRRPFEDMGIASEDTQPAIQIPRPPARGSAASVPRREDATIEVDADLDVEK